jgi:serine/threonine protein kinase
MEWVHGGSLHDILTASPNHRIDCLLAAGIAARVCAGLHAAHEATDQDGAALHIVHRDVSPQNILVSVRGEVRLADFGVARAKGQLHHPTRTGELKGKLGYMAPEQLTSKNFDRRADVFALGCVLYQATTGTRPFYGADPLESMYRLLETECALPSTLVSDYPVRLEAIVQRALSKSIDDRFQSAKELELELVQFLGERDESSTQTAIAALVEATLSDSLRRREQELEAARRALDEPYRTDRPPLRDTSPSRWVSHRDKTIRWWVAGAIVAVTAAAFVLKTSSPRAINSLAQPTPSLGNLQTLDPGHGAPPSPSTMNAAPSALRTALLPDSRDNNGGASRSDASAANSSPTPNARELAKRGPTPVHEASLAPLQATTPVAPPPLSSVMFSTTRRTDRANRTKARDPKRPLDRSNPY